MSTPPPFSLAAGGPRFQAVPRNPASRLEKQARPEGPSVPGAPPPAARRPGPPGPAPGLQRDVAVEQPAVLGVGRLLGAAGRGLSGERVVRGGRAGVAPWSEVAPVQGVNGGRVVLVGGVRVRERRRRRPEPRVVLQAALVI